MTSPCCHNINNHKHLYLLISLLLLSTNKVILLAHGRTTLKLLQEFQRQGGEKMEVRSMIGSRPPRCISRCSSCGHCEAIQVPIIPQDKNGDRHNFPTRIYSRGDDYGSNYKPMSWKCKCGDVIFNP